ncbi:MAG TPA: glycosyltransferase family 2 protein [Gammaproteobacteria bacterium]|nr:glycosyltransferase family 2 protein [Gammaproteobacteria bacterium]
MKLSVVIPSYNEQSRLPQTLLEAQSWLDEHFPKSYEILVVDDGSEDQTCAEVIRIQNQLGVLQLLRLEQNTGKGAAVRKGMLAARGDIIVYMDADHSTHIREITKAIEAIAKGADVVIASRRHPQSQIPRHQSWLRENMGRTFRSLMYAVVNLEFQDTQCGFKAFTYKSTQQLFTRQRLNGFSFDVELLYIAKKLGLTVQEIPVCWINEPNSRVRMIVDPLRMFLDITRISNLHKDL